MASTQISKSSSHARSISFPSIPHPITDQFEKHLCRLRTSQLSSSVNHNLSGLKDLYHCVHELLKLPLSQQSLSLNVHGKSVEEILEGSVTLLDICGVSRDILIESKGYLQDIQSVLRRKCSGELSVTDEVAQYLKTRKIAKKTIKKCFKNIKVTDKCNVESSIVGMLKDVEEISVDVFKSLLSSISGVKLQSRKTSWPVFSKHTHQSSEFDAVDAALESLICQKKKRGIDVSQVENTRNLITELESEIRGRVEELECLSRHLVRTRACVLNILSN